MKVKILTSKNVEETNTIDGVRHNNGMGWRLYDNIKELAYDDRASYREFSSNKALQSYMSSSMIAPVIWSPFMRDDLNKWDFSKKPLKVCFVYITRENGEYLVLAYSTKMYIVSDTGETLDSINLLI